MTIDLFSAFYLVLLGVLLGLFVPAARASRRRFAALAAEDGAAGAGDPAVAGEADALPDACSGCNLAHLREAVEYWRAEAGRQSERANFYYGMVAGDNRRGGQA